jgi:hypothetical protein
MNLRLRSNDTVARKELYFFLVEAFFAGFFAAAFFVAIVTSWVFRLSAFFGRLERRCLTRLSGLPVVWADACLSLWEPH